MDSRVRLGPPHSRCGARCSALACGKCRASWGLALALAVVVWTAGMWCHEGAQGGRARWWAGAGLGWGGSRLVNLDAPGRQVVPGLESGAL
eukprot:3203986-Alexandrium_andersonii.AAC.1